MGAQNECRNIHVVGMGPLGANCDYNKSLRQIHKTLELKEVYALKDKFSPENCRRITWAILDDGRAFFDDVKTTIDFTVPEMTFPQSFLIDILNSVRYAVSVERASFPDEWRCRERKEDKGGKTPGTGQGSWNHTGDNTPKKGGYGSGSGGEKQQHPYGYGGAGGGQGGNRYGGQGFSDPFGRRGGGSQGDCRSGWTNVRNHKIKELMDPYLERYNGRIHLAEVLDAAGKRQTDLPTLPRFCHSNGRPFESWASRDYEASIRLERVYVSRESSWCNSDRITQERGSTFFFPQFWFAKISSSSYLLVGQI